MGYLNKETFVCIDCETTGLDLENDRIIEIAICRFTFSEILESFESLINPEIKISQESMQIHNITEEMCENQPKIEEILPKVFKIAGNCTIMGHGIQFDIDMLTNSAKRFAVKCDLHQNKLIDTLRLARMYGQSPINSLQFLRKHFNVEEEIAHRAMGDVLVNIEVFKKLTQNFKTTDEIFRELQKPIQLSTMPLGKYKGRKFSEIPDNHLKWASHQNFDQDLLFSLRKELKLRKQGANFLKAANPFSQLD
ncbi:MAG: DNA polymerase III PolC-type [Chlamydiae bacterium]|nr:DNA polymerase III PolC-type [Chlamydiota bacterium]